ncbi:hypothetical protein GF386_00330 [Candidatus Pacearchaeota archaeon]|nr:hypothetical protein [Candidatus Pacearchaeota archaeon]MBD3282729.1 hypothetical protein [Candidatus Pacearchaeota archaeon]
MKFRIPFTFSDIAGLKKKSKFFSRYIKHRRETKLGDSLKNADISMTREEYLSISLRTFVIAFIFLYIFITTILILINIKFSFLLGFALSIVFSFFVLFSQLVYPKIYVMRRQRNIDKNLISALEDMLVQLDSGIPLFSVLVNISSSGYGELSLEFKKAVKKINAGIPEQEVIEELSKSNPSPFFKRTLWQISNGMNAGSNMSIVIRDSIKSLNEEQMIQIQNYGNKLNPLIVFYMLIAVIIPALSITFLTIISSMLGMPKNITTVLFLTLFVFVILIQIMFLGIIKSKRPSLL